MPANKPKVSKRGKLGKQTGAASGQPTSSPPPTDDKQDPVPVTAKPRVQFPTHPR